MKKFFQFFGLWPGSNNNLLFFFYVLLSTLSLISQFWNISSVYQNLELLTINISNIIMVFAILIKMSLFWSNRR